MRKTFKENVRQEIVTEARNDLHCFLWKDTVYVFVMHKQRILKIAPGARHVVTSAGFLNKNTTLRTATGIASGLPAVFGPNLQ